MKSFVHHQHTQQRSDIRFLTTYTLAAKSKKDSGAARSPVGVATAFTKNYGLF